MARSDDSLHVRIAACGSDQLVIVDARLRCVVDLLRRVRPERARRSDAKVHALCIPDYRRVATS